VNPSSAACAIGPGNRVDHGPVTRPLNAPATSRRDANVPNHDMPCARGDPESESRTLGIGCIRANNNPKRSTTTRPPSDTTVPHIGFHAIQSKCATDTGNGWFVYTDTTISN
jgi:hypothetical protein